MNKEPDISLIRTLFAGLSNRLFISHTALEQLRLNETLSPAGMLSVKTIRLCYRHINHLCQFIDYLTSEKNTTESGSCDCFDSAEFLSGITKAFSETISGYLPIITTCTSKLKTPLSIQVNKTKFETVFLNILYGCLKSVDYSECRNTKLALSVSESKNYVIFHIRTNCTSPTSEIIEQILLSQNHCTADIYSQDAVLALSLKIASMFINEIDGKISYKTLKQGSRYDISLPKASTEIATKLHSPQTYQPTIKYFEETFAEFILQALFKL